MSTQTVTVRSPRGRPALLTVRDDTNDLATVGSVFADVVGSPLVDEYDLAALTVSGMFLDVGAHIGAVTVAVLLDNPDAQAMCLEPLPENVELIGRNLAQNLLPAEVIQGAVAPGRFTNIAYDFEGPEALRTHRYVGNLAGIMRGPKGSPSARYVTVKAYGLARLVKMAGGEFDAVKTDCEGGEWALLDSPAVRHCRVIFGEYHHRDPQALHQLLDRTHNLAVSPTGAAFGTFRAVRR